MKNIYLKFLILISSFYSSLAFGKTGDDTILKNMAPGGNSILEVDPIDKDSAGINVVDSLLNITKDTIFGLLPIIATFVFLFIGAKLFMARGNSEEFKKALMWFVYAAIGLAIIPMAWGVIYLITTLTI